MQSLYRFLPVVLLALPLTIATSATAGLDAKLRERVARDFEEPISTALVERTTALLERAAQWPPGASRGATPHDRVRCDVADDGLFVCVVRPAAPGPAAPPAAFTGGG